MNRNLTIFLIAFSLVIGCKREEKKNKESLTVKTCVYPDLTGHIQAHIGDTIQIKLIDSLYDGGYEWTIKHDFSSTIANFLNYWTVYTGDTGITGAPMLELWRYHAIAVGNDTLILNLCQPWQPNIIHDTKSFYLKVIP